jgi:hypothetical protein
MNIFNIYLKLLSFCERTAVEVCVYILSIANALHCHQVSYLPSCSEIARINTKNYIFLFHRRESIHAITFLDNIYICVFSYLGNCCDVMLCYVMLYYVMIGRLKGKYHSQNVKLWRITMIIHSVAFSPQATYTDWATSTGRRIECQLLWIEGCRVISAVKRQRPLISVF